MRSSAFRRRRLTIRSSGPLRRAVALSCGTRQRPLSSGVRATVKLILFLGVALLVGVALGLQGARLAYGHLDVEKVLSELHEQSAHSTSTAQLWLTTLEAIEKGDTAKATRVSCLSLKLSLAGIKPDENNPEKAAKTREFLER